MTNDPILELRGITKRYGAHTVLDRVSLSVGRGSIHALVGENGAGKSTLMNLLFGMPVIRETGGYEGDVVLDGRVVRFGSPAEAMAAGLGMVHQEFMLLGGLSVAENIKLNREPTRPNLASRLLGPKLELVDRRRAGEDARRALDRVGLDVDAWLPVAGLPVGHMQFVEIAREVDKRSERLIIFDEPTAVLTEGEARRLLDVMRELASGGLGLLFITHRLDEVLEVADAVTVLRDGRVVASPDPRATSVGRLAELMVGREAGAGSERADRGRRAAASEAGGGGPPALSIRGLSVEMPGEAVRGVDLEVARGEILGIGGLAGHGKVGVANGLMGLQPARGEVLKDGRPLPLGDARGAIRAGLGFVSEDRRGVGILPDESIELNVAITAIEAQNRFLRRGPIAALRLIDGGAMRAHALRMIERLDVRCTGPRQELGRLSGGNQQKVCLARALTLEPDVLLVSEPTRGIDVGAKRLVLDTLLALNRDRGLTLVVTSSELAELRALCDRIAIVYRGRIEAVLAPDAPDESFGLAMAGELSAAHGQPDAAGGERA